jgi:hypothetical protein
MINFTYEVAELGFDQASVTAVCEPGGDIVLRDISLVNERVRLTGTGRITSVEGLDFRERPLSLELQFWAQGHPASLLSTAGLLSSAKDKHGYSKLKQPIHLGGTLARINVSQWHRLLVKAATPKP